MIFFLYGSEREKEQQYGLGRRRKVDYRTKLYCNVKKGLQEQCVSPVRLEDEVAVCEPLQQRIFQRCSYKEFIINSQQNLYMQVELLQNLPQYSRFQQSQGHQAGEEACRWPECAQNRMFITLST